MLMSDAVECRFEDLWVDEEQHNEEIEDLWTNVEQHTEVINEIKNNQCV
jgi:hypothetical protein